MMNPRIGDLKREIVQSSDAHTRLKINPNLYLLKNHHLYKGKKSDIN